MSMMILMIAILIMIMAMRMLMTNMMIYEYEYEYEDNHKTVLSYIQKTGLACWKIPQQIQIFRRKIVLERENYQFCNVLEKDQQASSKTKVK